MECNVLCDLLHALFRGPLKDRVFDFCCLAVVTKHKRNALSNTQICQQLYGRWHTAKSWSVPEISELRYHEGGLDMN